MNITETNGKFWIQISVAAVFFIFLFGTKVEIRFIEYIFMASFIGYSFSLIGIAFLKKKSNSSLTGLLHIFEYFAMLFAPFVWVCILFTVTLFLG